MKISGYSFDMENVAHQINKNKYQNILIQLPEGLKPYFDQFIETLEKKTSCNVFVYADPCFGACDIITRKNLEAFEIDFIIQFGHTPIPALKRKKDEIPTLFINAISLKDVTQVVEHSLPLLIGKNIGVVTTAQHLHTLPSVERFLKDHSYHPWISKGDNRVSGRGQILGCNFSAGLSMVDKVDSFLFIGSGTFHPLGLLLATKKPVIAADPYTQTVKHQELEEIKDAVLRQRYGAITLAKTAKSFGILISVKPGQQRMKTAERIKKLLDALGKTSYFIVMDLFSPSYLEGFTKIDCYVSTGCPRIAIDDYLLYKKPIITPVELEVAFGQRNWEEYEFDQII